MSRTTKAAEAAVFSKAQLLRAERFTPQQRDWLHALLQDDVAYTVDEAGEKLEQLLSREAK